MSDSPDSLSAACGEHRGSCSWTQCCPIQDCSATSGRAATVGCGYVLRASRNQQHSQPQQVTEVHRALAKSLELVVAPGGYSVAGRLKTHQELAVLWRILVLGVEGRPNHLQATKVVFLVLGFPSTKVVHWVLEKGVRLRLPAASSEVEGRSAAAADPSVERPSVER